MTLVEVLIATLILAMISVPIYYLFTSSSRMNASSRHVAVGRSLANSLLSSIDGKFDFAALTEIDRTADFELSGDLALSSLGVSPCSTGFKRDLQILRKIWAESGQEAFHIVVDVSWENPVNKNQKHYVLHSIMAEEE